MVGQRGVDHHIGRDRGGQINTEGGIEGGWIRTEGNPLIALSEGPLADSGLRQKRPGQAAMSSALSCGSKHKAHPITQGWQSASHPRKVAVAQNASLLSPHRGWTEAEPS
jgi:hypothetical protein